MMCGFVKRLVHWSLVFVFFVVSTSFGVAQGLDSLDKRALKKLRNKNVFASIAYQPGHLNDVMQHVGEQSQSFVFAHSVMAQLPADVVLKISQSKSVEYIEIIDSGLAPLVYNLLQRLELLYRYHRTGMFAFNALNLSLAPDRPLLNKRPDRTGKRLVSRALQKFTKDLGVPVFMAVGNDGPSPGFVNPWAKSPGVIAATAADVNGTFIYGNANRPLAYSGSEEWHLFAGWGVHTIGALGAGITKTAQMLEDEKAINLTEWVGAGNEHLFSVRSGTSFASPYLMKMACPVHQFSQFLEQSISATDDMNIELRPFVRAIVDTSIDREHPVFKNRLVDSRRKYSGLMFETTASEKNALVGAFQHASLDVDLEYRTDVVVRFLKEIARPVVGAEGADGHGYADWDSAIDFIKQARVSDAVKLFADPDDPRRAYWLSTTKGGPNPVVLPSELAEAIGAYCQERDLVLPLGLFR